MSNRQTAWIVSALLILAGAVWFSQPESCQEWQQRYSDASEAYEASDSLEDFYAKLAVDQEKPEGCH